jgi:RND family efflux transporter MFP subunit
VSEHDRDEPQARERRRGWLWALASVAVLAAGGAVFAVLTLAGGQEGGQEPEPPLVQAVTVERAELLILTQTAFVRPRREVTVAPEVSGRIAEVGENFRLGARVEEGDLLVRLEQERFEAQLARGEAAVEQARAALAEARVNRDRQQELKERDFASEAALQQSIVGVARAEADLATARAQLADARIALEDTTLSAPFDALVTEESAAVGQLVQAGSAVGTLVGAEAAEAFMGLTPGDLEVLGEPEQALGGRVLVRAVDRPGAVLRRGVVVDVDPRIVADTRTVALVVRIPRPFEADPRPLRVDELVELSLPVSLENRNALRLPPEAVKDTATVWRIADGALERVEADVIDRGEGRVVVEGDGLGAGDLVMLSDLPAPFDGKRVRVERAASGAGEDADAPGDGAQAASPEEGTERRQARAAR